MTPSRQWDFGPGRVVRQDWVSPTPQHNMLHAVFSLFLCSKNDKMAPLCRLCCLRVINIKGRGCCITPPPPSVAPQNPIGGCPEGLACNMFARPPARLGPIRAPARSTRSASHPTARSICPIRWSARYDRSAARPIRPWAGGGGARLGGARPGGARPGGARPGGARPRILRPTPWRTECNLQWCSVSARD